MKKIGLPRAGFFGALVGGAAVAVSYLGHRLIALAYVPFDIFDWLPAFWVGIVFVLVLLICFLGPLAYAIRALLR